jgi:predicted dienelactone hydrolase/cyclophilin family peptidyl-prolyl cis-trans isomerase
MTATDTIMITALLVFLFAYWHRRLKRRSTVLTAASVVAFACAILGIMNYRWQAWPTLLLAIFLVIGLMISHWRKPQPSIRRIPWISGSLLVLLTAFALLPIYLFPVFALPEPDGSHTVGVRDFELIDASRPGLMEAAQNEPRRLKVRVWYPAGSVSGLHMRPYFTEQEVIDSASSLGPNLGLPAFFFTHLGLVKTHSYLDAPPLESEERWPVVFFSHGYSSHLGQNTALMEHLASHGYLVFSVQHSYDSTTVRFDDGSTAGMGEEWFEWTSKMSTEGFPEAERKMLAGRNYDERYEGAVETFQAMESQDQRLSRSVPVWRDDRMFLLESVANGLVPEAVKKIVAGGDYSRVGHLGMSFGGSTAASVCQVDPRCAAAVNLDGGNFDSAQFNRDQPAPFLMMHSDWMKDFAEFFPDSTPDPEFGFNDLSYERFETAGLNPDMHRLRVENSKHLGFSDMGLMARQPVRGILFGDIDGGEMVAIQNDVVLGFLDRYLGGLDNDFPAGIYDSHPAVLPHDAGGVRKWWLAKHPEDTTEQVVLETDIGEIEVALYPSRAPLSAANFLAYVDAGLFDGAEFYRATEKKEGGIDIIQGGLMAEAMKLPLDEIVALTSSLPPIAHETTTQTSILNERGTIALGRLAPGTASSEFFINIGNNPELDTGFVDDRLDGLGYAAFGRVMRGMRVAEKIQSLPIEQDSGNAVVKGQLLSDPVLIRKAYRVSRQRLD